MTETTVPLKIHRELARNAERGAKWLDEVRPNWFKRVKTTKLDMRDGCNCVHGQCNTAELIDEIAEGERKYPRMTGSEEAYPKLGYSVDTKRYGWDDQDALWDVLQEEWLRQIQRRRQDAKAAA